MPLRGNLLLLNESVKQRNIQSRIKQR